jgi:hypothetical protein
MGKGSGGGSETNPPEKLPSKATATSSVQQPRHTADTPTAPGSGAKTKRKPGASQGGADETEPKEARIKPASALNLETTMTTTSKDVKNEN